MKLEPARTALLVMDLQADVMALPGMDAAPAVERVGPVIEAARAAGVAVIYVVVGFRPGYPEVSPRNGMFTTILGGGKFVGTSAVDIAPAIAPRADDVVIVKHRVNAFHGTDLDMILRAKGIDTLLLAGVATSGVVLSTTCHAADADYRVAILHDCCADRDPEVHRVLLEKALVRRATMLSAAEAVAALS